MSERSINWEWVRHMIRRRRLEKHKARIGWERTPAFWKAEFVCGSFTSAMLGAGHYVVRMNNAQDEPGWYQTREAAELEAARLNFQRGSYYMPQTFGLDGI